MWNTDTTHVRHFFAVCWCPNKIIFFAAQKSTPLGHLYLSKKKFFKRKTMKKIANLLLDEPELKIMVFNDDD